MEHELARLPRWALVAFAVRCASRAKSPHPVAAKSRELAAHAARNAEAQDENYLIANGARVRPVALDTVTVGDVAIANIPSANAAFFAAAAACGAPCDVFAQAIRAAICACYAPSGGGGLAFHAAQVDDIAQLNELASRQGWTDDSPVDPDLLGPLWPEEGLPEWATPLGKAIEVPPIESTLPAPDDTPETEGEAEQG